VQFLQLNGQESQKRPLISAKKRSGHAETQLLLNKKKFSRHLEHVFPAMHVEQFAEQLSHLFVLLFKIVPAGQKS